MMGWKQFLSRIRKEEAPDESQSEKEQDARFAEWLETEGHFPARPAFQADLRSRLQSRLTVQTASKPVSSALVWVRLAPALVGVIALFLFTFVLVSGLSAPESVNSTPVAGLATSDNGTGGQGEKLFTVYDQASQSYVNLDEAAKTVGFAPRLPGYVPDGYKLENVALTYDTNAQTAPATPSPAPETRSNRGMGMMGSGPRGFQFQLTPVKASDGSTVQIYQLLAPGGGPNGPRFDVQGAMRFDPKSIQGARGYFIQGARWRVNYPESEAGNQATSAKPSGTPKAANTRPAGPPQGQGRAMPSMPFRGGRPGGPPPGFKPPVQLAFGRNENPNATRPGAYIDFQFGDPGKATRSLVWEKDGILIVLVANDTISDAELQRIAESFKPSPVKP